MSDDTATPTTVTADRLPFAQIPHALIRDKALTISARAVYGDLMARADNATDECFPGIRTIASDVGISTSTARKAITDLEAAGWITVTRQGHKGKGAVRKANRYHVHLKPVQEPLPTTDAGEHVPTTDAGERVATIATDAWRPSLPTRSDNRYVTRTIELQPENKTLAAKPRKYAWDILTDTEQGFGLPVERESQQRRVGKLTADITSTLEHHGVDVDDQAEALRLAALSWPQHFPDATLTPDAFAKHLPALLRPPLRRTADEVEAERMRQWAEAACTHQRSDGITAYKTYHRAEADDYLKCDQCGDRQPVEVSAPPDLQLVGVAGS